MKLLYQKIGDELPTSDVIISALEKIVKAFEDSTQIDLIRQRWEEIKKAELPNQETAEFDTFLYNVFRSKNMNVDLENHLLKQKFDEIFKCIQQDPS